MHFDAWQYRVPWAQITEATRGRDITDVLDELGIFWELYPFPRVVADHQELLPPFSCFSGKKPGDLYFRLQDGRYFVLADRCPDYAILVPLEAYTSPFSAAFRRFFHPKTAYPAYFFAVLRVIFK